MDNEEHVLDCYLLWLVTENGGEGHTAYEHMFRQFKTEALGKAGLKNAKNVADELIREGFIIKKPTHYGLQVSLNPKKAWEIKELIKDDMLPYDP